MSQLVLEAVPPARPGVQRAAFLVITAAASILALALISTRAYQPSLIVVALAGAIFTACSVSYTAHHTEWLIFAIGFLYLAISTSLLSEAERAVLHYGVLLAFCLPILSRFYKSGLIWQGNFKLYCAYFAWALATTYYSLTPEFSASRWAGAVLGFVAAAVSVMDIQESRDCNRLLTRFLLACAIATTVTLVGGIVLPSSITWQTPADGLDPGTLILMQEHGVRLTGIDRFRGVFGNANDVGGLMLITVTTALSCWRGAARPKRVLISLVVIVAVGLAVRADSRSPFVALGAGGALYALWRYRTRGAVGIALALIAIAGLLSVVTDVASYVSRGDVWTLTGRTDIWAYVIQKIRERPVLGYGYEVSGAVFDSRYFPLWYGPWDEGPHSSLHNGYLSHFIGVGVPATLLWLFILLRPWVFVLRQEGNPWNLKTTAILLVVPLLVSNLTEAAISDFTGADGFLFGLVWAIAERYRLLELAKTAQQRASALDALPGAVRALRER